MGVMGCKNVPPWLPTQQGALPEMPLTYQAPLAPMPVPPSPVTPPPVPPHFFGQAYPPGRWPPIPNYTLALLQPPPVGYPLLQWPPYLLYYVIQQLEQIQHEDVNVDSETTQHDKFTSPSPCWTLI